MKHSQHLQRMSLVISHIETNLDKNLSLNELASIACYSTFHFHRIFKAFTGQTVYAFQNRLRLERAIAKLKYTQDSVTSIALDAGFDTASSFNKAFKRQFDVTPTSVRKHQLAPISPKNLIEEGKTMTVEITHINSFDVISARATGNYQESAAKAWQTVMQFAYGNKLMNEQVESIGITHDDPDVTESSAIRYDACLTLDADISAFPELKKTSIAGGRYAKFLHKGSYDNLAASYQFIFNDWLVSSNEELRDAPCFEKYLNRDPRRTKPENLRTEIYVPLK